MCVMFATKGSGQVVWGIRDQDVKILVFGKVYLELSNIILVRIHHIFHSLRIRICYTGRKLPVALKICFWIGCEELVRQR